MPWSYSVKTPPASVTCSRTGFRTETASPSPFNEWRKAAPPSTPKWSHRCSGVGGGGGPARPPPAPPARRGGGGAGGGGGGPPSPRRARPPPPPPPGGGAPAPPPA